MDTFKLYFFNSIKTTRHGDGLDVNKNTDSINNTVKHISTPSYQIL